MSSSQYRLKQHPQKISHYPGIDEKVEQFCEMGCSVVRKTIADFDHGELTEDLHHLSEEERQHVIAELRDIMAVYEKNGGGCGS
ncbi:MAG: hypothetical protein OEZ10_01690 [Gammaproteobacteria bacterium]|nr:hypothetical protein [Gammaproteobacteria bacterium]